jgi:cyanophycinase-like exopeptidase
MGSIINKLTQAIRRFSRSRRLRPSEKPLGRRFLKLESLESRELFAAAPIAALGSKSTLLIPAYTSPVRFTVDFSDTASKNELGYFYVDGPDGRITRRQDADLNSPPALNAKGQVQYLRPGDTGYLDLAFASWNSGVIFASGEVGESLRPSKTLNISGDRFIAFFIIKDTSVDNWRSAPANSKPNAWVSLGDANSDKYEHFQATRRQDPFFRNNLLQYRVEDSNLANARTRKPGNDSDINDLVFSVNILPYLTQDNYSVFNKGADFNGAPEGFSLSASNGLLANDYLASNPNVKPTLTHVSIDDGANWLEVQNIRRKQTQLVLSDQSLHGVLTVNPSGAIDFQPDPNDSYWKIKATSQRSNPDAITFLYRAFDGFDSAQAKVTITHGYYQRGAGLDNLHQGQRMYLLGGGGDRTKYEEGLSEFFQKGSNSKDIVLVSQHSEQLEFVNQVFATYAAGKARSVTSLNITTREQAMDPRFQAIISGADAIWFGDGNQSIYQSIFFRTPMFTALAKAAGSPVAIGAEGAATAILGQAAFIGLPWDDIQSRFATQQSQSTRVQIQTQGTQLPFSGIVTAPNGPLNGLIIDSHFANNDRMGRLATLMAKSRLRGLGIDRNTAMLITGIGNQWRWSVIGQGSTYLVSPSTSKTTPKTQDGGRLNYGPLSVTKLPSGTTSSPILVQARESYRIVVSQGTIFTTENGGKLY